MLGERWKRRLKRRTLEFVVGRGYDIQKEPSRFPPYRFLRRLSLGEDALADARTIHGGQLECVFDVGAHVGQSAAEFLDAFPRARIHSFEPAPASYEELQKLAERNPRVNAVNAAVGNRDGQADFFINKLSVTNSLLTASAGAGDFLVAADGLDRREVTTVRLVTLDTYCAAQGIERIDLLKLDTQGYELRVLDGARRLIEQHAVPLIHLEVCFVRFYEEQPLFPEVYQYLYDRDYRLVWLYDSSFHLYAYAVAANALFVHRSLGERLAKTRR
jgi:FkbM family methyltransferase